MWHDFIIFIIIIMLIIFIIFIIIIMFLVSLLEFIICRRSCIEMFTPSYVFYFDMRVFSYLYVISERFQSLWEDKSLFKFTRLYIFFIQLWMTSSRWKTSMLCNTEEHSRTEEASVSLLKITVMYVAVLDLQLHYSLSSVHTCLHMLLWD